MYLSTQKRMAAKLLRVGLSRVRVQPSKEVGEALTREDVRQLIEKGLISAVPARGNPGSHRRHILKQKAKGRRSKHGSRKGTAGTRTPPKARWMKAIRAQRALLHELKPQMEQRDYVETYRKIKGGMFRSTAHVRFYLHERELLKQKPAKKPEPTAPKQAKAAKAPAKTTGRAGTAVKETHGP